MAKKDNNILSKGRVRRGIYLLPNLLTTGNLFAGFHSMLFSFSNEFQLAMVLIFVAAVLDALDGRVARLINAQSDFGKEYDSFSDVISFGVAPAVLVYSWSLTTLGTIGNALAFLYMVATALRLARFNTQAGGFDRRYFQGLPSPAAACFISSCIWVQHSEFAVQNGQDGWLIAANTIILVVTAVLMVSTTRYPSFKDINFRDKIPFLKLLAVVLVFILLALRPALMLFFLTASYVSVGIIYAVQVFMQRRRKHSQDGEPEQQEDS